MGSAYSIVPRFFVFRIILSLNKEIIEIIISVSESETIVVIISYSRFFRSIGLWNAQEIQTSN